VELSRRAARIVAASALLALVAEPASPQHRVGPSYLYPTAATPGVVNPEVTQANN